MSKTEALGTRLHKVWTARKKVGIMHMFKQIHRWLFLCLVLTSEVSVLLYNNCEEFFDILKFYDFLNFYLRLVMYFLDFNFVTMFYIRKIKDGHRIMSQAINKEVDFSSQ